MKIIPPQPDGYSRTCEDFRGKTGVTFDALAPAESAAQLTVGLILNPQRDTRLVEYHAENAEYPGLNEVIDDLINSTWRANPGTGYLAAIQRTVDNVVLDNLMRLAENPDASEQVRAIAYYNIAGLKEWMQAQVKTVKDQNLKTQYTYAVSQIKRFQANPVKFKVPAPVVLPPGNPIGEY